MPGDQRRRLNVAIEKPDAKVESKSSNYFDRVVEVYKARLTLFVTLMVAMVTLTGYAYQNKRSDLFLLASAIPLLALMFDIFMKREFACPFLYKALLSDLSIGDPEPMAALFLDFRSALQSRYVKLLTECNGEERRATFRKAYVNRGLWIKSILAGGGFAVELLLALK
jgi:hypothetical protein